MVTTRKMPENPYSQAFFFFTYFWLILFPDMEYGVFDSPLLKFRRLHIIPTKAKMERWRAVCL